MSRTKKKPYTKSKVWDKSCRCHGGCGYCLSNRMHKNDKHLQEKVIYEVIEMEENNFDDNFLYTPRISAGRM